MYTYREFFLVLSECVQTHPDGRIRIDGRYVTINAADYLATTLYEFYKSGRSVHQIARALMDRSLREIEDASLMGAHAVLMPFCDKHVPKIQTDNLMLVARLGNRLCTYADMLQKGYADEESFLMDLAVKTMNQTEPLLLRAAEGDVYFLSTRDIAAGALPVLFPDILKKVTDQTGAEYLLPLSDKGALVLSEKSLHMPGMKEALQEMGSDASCLYRIQNGRLEKTDASPGGAR